MSAMYVQETLLSVGKLSEAHVVFRCLMAIHEINMGPGHLSVAEDLNCLAVRFIAPK